MEIIDRYYPIILTFLAALVWLIRLESQVQKHDKDIEAMRCDNKAEIKEINRKLDLMTSCINDLAIKVGELTGFIKGKEGADERQ